MTAVPLGEYVRKLEIGTRRHPMAEWPIALQITAARK
jgi:hypothetical protein